MKDITIKANISIHQAMKALDKTAEKCLLVIDDNNKFLGTLTDGDLRRSILAGVNFSENISDSYTTKPTILKQDEYNPEKAKQLLLNCKLDLIPIVDEHHTVVDYVTWSSLGEKIQPYKSSLNVPIVIMAGGKGTRLKPFTNILPKPLVPVQGKPIIEHIIERFSDFGCSDYHLTVNYKGKILKAYFEELKPDYKVSFVEEKKPLGTAGSLRYFIGKFNEPFIVTNCDIIIKTDYTNLYEFHKKSGYDVTLVACAKKYVIPYGTCKLNADGHLSHINEKPHYDFLINTGFYVINPDLLKLIPENKLYHITYLIEEAKNQGKNVGVFPIDDDAWIDVGQWAEYRRAVELL